MEGREQIQSALKLVPALDHNFENRLEGVKQIRCSTCEGSMSRSRYICSICIDFSLCVDCGEHWDVLHEHCVSSRAYVTFGENFQGLSGTDIPVQTLKKYLHEVKNIYGGSYYLQIRDSSGCYPDQPINSSSCSLSRVSYNSIAENQVTTSKINNLIEKELKEKYYGKVENRLETFDDYTDSHSDSQNTLYSLHPSILAAAGFIYVGPKGGTRCFKCDWFRKFWLSSENPFDIHARMSPLCEFVLENMPHKVTITEDQFVDDGSFQRILLKEKRSHGMLEDPMDTHRHIATSQYYSLMSFHAGLPVSIRLTLMTYQLDYVEYIHNPNLAQRFTQQQAAFQAKYDGEEIEKQNYILAFHGTPAHNIDSIARNNFDKNLSRRKAYGDGVYFSEYPDVSIGYTAGCMCLLLCKILPGHCETYPPKGTSYDSVKVINPTIKDDLGRGWAVVITENMDQILPYCVLHLKR